MRLSVIIPTYQEEGHLLTTLKMVMSERPFEVIVVDAASQDRTQEIALQQGARVITVKTPCRGTQLNIGAGQANGDVFLFLHADTRPPRGYLQAISQAIHTGAAWGFFQLAIDHSGIRFRLLERLIKLRCHLLKLHYGDQAMFMRRDLFEEIGGFQELPILEDLDLLMRARRMNRPVLLPQKVFTSARRWKRDGIIKVSLQHQLLLLGYLLGISPSILKQIRKDRT